MYGVGYAHWGAAVACYAGSLAIQVFVVRFFIVFLRCRALPEIHETPADVTDLREVIAMRLRSERTLGARLPGRNKNYCRR